MPRLRTFPLLITVLVAVALTYGVLQLLTFHEMAAAGTGFRRGWVYSWHTVSACAGILALLLAWLLPDRLDVRLLAVYVASATVMFALDYDGDGYRPITATLAQALVLILGTGTLLRFTAIFPRTLGAREVRETPTPRPLARLQLFFVENRWAPWALGVATAVLFLAHAHLTLPGELQRLPVVTRTPTPLTQATSAGTVVTVVTLATVAGLNLRTGYRVSGRDARARILWMVQGFLSGAVLILLIGLATMAAIVTRSPALSWVGPLSFYGFPLAHLLILAGFAAAVFVGGALDASAAVRKTTLYGLLGFVLTAVFVAVEEGLSALVVERLGLPGGTATWAAALSAALVFQPAHRWMKARTDRLLARMLPIRASGEATDAVRAILHPPADAAPDQSAHARDLFRLTCRKIADGRGGSVPAPEGDEVVLVFQEASDADAAAPELMRAFAEPAGALGLEGWTVRVGTDDEPQPHDPGGGPSPGTLAVLILFVALGACGDGSDATGPDGLPPVPEEAIAWLRADAMPFEPTEPGERPSELEPLRDLVGDARIVPLGESTHGSRELFGPERLRRTWRSRGLLVRTCAGRASCR